METVFIPDMKQMEIICFSPIARFSSLCEALNSKKIPQQQINYSSNKLQKDVLNAEFPEINELSCLLRQTLSVIADSQEGKRKRPISQIIRDTIIKTNSNGCKILLKPTLDKARINKHKDRVREMERLMGELLKVNCGLKKQIEMMSIAASNVAKYEFLLTIAKNDNCFIADKIKARELRAREKKVAKLQQKLNELIKKAEKVKTEYNILMTKEAMARTSLKQMERHIWDSIKTDLKESINIGLASLKTILASSSIKASSYLLEHIQNMEKDCSVVVLNAIDRLSYRYQFTTQQ